MKHSDAAHYDHIFIECFRQLWNYTDDSMFIMAAEANGEFSLFDSNPTSKRLMGLDEQFFGPGLDIREAWNDDIVESFYKNYREAAQAREPTVVEQHLADEDGNPSIWHTLLVPLYNDQGQSTYVCGVARNVTVLKEAEKSARIAQQQSDIYNKALSRINENLEAKVYERTQELMRANSAKQRFLANISHELRTPLTGIIGNTESLLMDGVSAEEVREAASYIHSNSRHLLNLMNDVLDISKIEAGKVELERDSVCLLSLFQDVQSIMAPQAKAKNLTFEIRYQDSLPESIYIDETRLKQILLNLTSNAVKFTEIGRVYVAVSYRDETLSIVVEDSGIGISREQQDKLFKAFSQSDNSITRRYGGTGLGLNLSMQFAQLMGGDIAVESQLGMGSRFTATVVAPRVSDACVDLQRVNVREPTTGLDQGLPQVEGRVLVAEDQPENNRLFCSILKRMGLQVSSVMNGRDAVSLLSSSAPFDLVLMDIQMPVMSGLDALQELRAMDIGCPVIALTANVMSDDVARYRSAGFDDYISKPFELKLFVEKVQQAVESRVPSDAVAVDKSIDAVPEEQDLKQMLKNRFPDYHQKISEAWHGCNLGILKSEVHQLKGATLLFGFAELGEACRAVEAALKLDGSAVLNLAAVEAQVEILLRFLSEPV